MGGLPGVNPSSWSCTNLVLCAMQSLHPRYLHSSSSLINKHTLNNSEGEQNREPRNKCQTYTLITDTVNQ